jgi:hypothetical protein
MTVPYLHVAQRNPAAPPDLPTLRLSSFSKGNDVGEAEVAVRQHVQASNLPGHA